MRLGKLLCLVLAVSSVSLSASAESYYLPGGMDNLRGKFNHAVSDYLEAISFCNGALRDSAERQIEQIRRTISASKDDIKRIYSDMVHRMDDIYSEFPRYIDNPNEAKAVIDTLMNIVPSGLGVPEVSLAYSGLNTVTDLEGRYSTQKKVADLLKRAKEQLREIIKTSLAYNDWARFGDEVAEELDRLRKDFRKECRGRELGSWRYEDAATLEQAGVADVSLEGKDRASGGIFTGRVRNNTGEPVTVDFPAGAWALPGEFAYQRMFITEGDRVSVPPGETRSVPLEGFCADPKKYPPPSEGSPDIYLPPSTPDSFLPDANPFNEYFTCLPLLPSTVDRLREEGRFPPTGLPPAMERLTLIQWLTWNIMEDFNPEDGKRKIEEQVRKTGGRQTPEQIQQLNENIWAGIDLVKKEVTKR